ncbi:MAG: MFS transporter [Lentisphaerae bacterium]|nr:MFS transporter [Lentisphaerota bacterium]
MASSRRMVFQRLDVAAFLSFFTYAAGSVVVPVALVALAADLGFPLDSGGMTAGGVLHLGRTLTMVGAMLFCGFAAGRWGQRRTFGWSVLLMALGLGLAALTPTYGVLLAAILLAGVGEGVVEGLATPFVQSLHAVEPGRYINIAHSFWSVGVFVTVLLSGALLSLGVSWRWLLAGIALLGIVPGALLLWPARGGALAAGSPPAVSWRRVVRQSVEILRLPRFWLFFTAMFLAGGGEFCLTFWSASYIQLYLNPAPWAGGVGTACVAAGMALGRSGWGYLIRQHHLHRLILGSALAGVAVTLCLPAVRTLGLFLVLLFLAGLATAPFWPSVQSRCADRLPQVDTTMLFILLSCAGVPGCGVLTWLMGVLGDGPVGLGRAFYLVPACYLILAGVIAWEGLLKATPRTPPAAAAPGGDGH